MVSLRGESRAQFEYLMDTVAAHNVSIDDLNSQIEDGKRSFNLLKQELAYEKNTSFLLTQQIETLQLDKVKDIDNLDRSLVVSQELDASKKELEVAHASLTKDCENLDNAYKIIKGELSNLREKYDQLRATHEKTLSTSSVPIYVENIACASNSTIDQALHVEENKKLKEQLEKERLSSTKKGKGLDEILSLQKMRPPRQGLGYVPSNGKKVANPPKPKEVGNVKKNVVNGEPQGATPETSARSPAPGALMRLGTNSTIF